MSQSSVDRLMNELGIQCPGNELLNNQAVDMDMIEAVPSGHHKVYPTAPETPGNQKGNRTNILTSSSRNPSHRYSFERSF